MATDSPSSTKRTTHDLTYDGGKVVAPEIRDDVAALTMAIATMRGFG